MAGSRTGALLATVVSLALVWPVAADTVVTSNGDRLSGSVLTMQDGVVSLETEYAGAVRIEWEQVVEVTLDEALPVVLEDGAEAAVSHLPTEGIALADVRAIAPPAPAPAAPEWLGRVDFGWAKASGNRSAELGTLTAFGERTRPDAGRLSLLLDAAKGSSEGEETADRARVEGKYDRAAGEGSYRYYLAGAGYDRVRDIDLRVELGSGLGRAMVDQPGNLLTAEVGLSYVRDEFADGSTEADAKLRLGEAWTREVGDGLELRQSLAMLSATDELGDYTAEFVLALRHRLSERLTLTSKLVNSYDSRPAAGTERSDVTLATQLGMTFGQ